MVPKEGEHPTQVYVHHLLLAITILIPTTVQSTTWPNTTTTSTTATAVFALGSGRQSDEFTAE